MNKVKNILLVIVLILCASVVYAKFEGGGFAPSSFSSSGTTYDGTGVANITATTANVTNLTVSEVTTANVINATTANVTGLATLSGGYTLGTPTTHAATESATAATLYGQVHIVSGAYTVTLPALSVGQSAYFCSSAASIYSIDSTSPNYFILAGTSLDAGDKITSDGSSGACVYFIVSGTNIIRVIFTNSTWIDGGT